MKRPRFTLRSLMAVVAVAALIAFGVAMLRRSAEFAARAERHRLQVMEDTLNAGSATSNALEHYLRPTPKDEADRRHFLRRAEIQKRLYEKYRSAARYPWLSVAPDEGEPD